MRGKPVISVSLLLTVAVVAPSAAQQFDRPGNILISDQFNNRVVEIDRQKHVVFEFGTNNPNLCNPGPGSVIAPNDAERLADGLTLVPGTGTSTCVDNRVIIVDRSGKIVWRYGTAGVTGAGTNELNVPVFAIQVPNGNILITDQGNNRVVEIDLITRKPVWRYGPKSGPGALNAPNSAEILHNGHILIADENNNRVLEITRAGTVVAMIDKGLNTVAFASRLAGGDTLIADAGNNRVVEFDRSLGTVMSCSTNTGPGSNANPNPTGAIRLRDGNTLVADQFNDRVIIIDPQCNVLFQYGQTNHSGHGPDQLNAPYSATMVGQYIGVTPPLR